MAPDHAYQECEDSYSLPPRSRAHSRVSSTASQFGNIQLVDSPRSLPLELSLSPSPSTRDVHPSPAYISPVPPPSSTYLPTPISQTYSPFPILTPEILNAEWTDDDLAPSDSTPLLRVDPAPDYSSAPSSSPLLTGETSTMSAVAALHFDPTFAMGSRSTFTWPGLDSSGPGGPLLHDLSSMGPGSDASLTPPMGSRSVTSSPPRANMTAEQRELKRQRDQARRSSKEAARIRRSSSNPYVQGPPITMADVSAAMTMPVYTTAPAPISLLAEPATTIGPQSYLPAYSPPLPEPTPANVYQSAYGQQLPPYHMGMDYPPTFPPTPYNRQPMPEQGVMYQVPAVMGGASGGHEGGHVRVVQSRPKPQCWEHGCNGRQFSTFSNLLRHQREKSGQAAKATCPNCGAEFTRTTARNGHLLHEKCKQRKNS